MPAYSRFLASLSAVLCAAAAACADAAISQNQDSNGAEPSEDAAAASNGKDSTSSEEQRVVDEVGLTTQAVVGGKKSEPCGWPSTVDISGCTGTLIHPRIVTTAAHCLMGRSASIKFTGGNGVAGSFTVMGQCQSGAFGTSGGSTGRDWGYCVLPDDPRIKMMQITPPLVGCEADRYLKPGNSAWVVGFGTTGSGLNDNGVKREVEVKINKVQNGTVDIGDKDVGACHGDSGGPLYIKVTDGTHDWGWRTAGSTSGAGGNCDCACSTVYVDIRQHVKAIEEMENIDVTPCTDDDGKWAPGPDCKDFITDPAKGTGTYPMCSAPVTREPIASCGEPAAGGAAGAAGGAANTAAAGSGGGAGARAAAAGSGGLSAAGAAGARATGAAGVNGAGSAAPSTGIGVTSQGAATAGAAAVATAGRAAPSLGTAGTRAVGALTAGRAAIGTSVNAATAAGGGAPVTTSTAAAAQPASDDSGCSVAHVGGMQQEPARATWLLSLLLGLAARNIRRRQRRGVWGARIRLRRL